MDTKDIPSMKGREKIRAAAVIIPASLYFFLNNRINVIIIQTAPILPIVVKKNIIWSSIKICGT